jgi:hypothetical protein
VSEFRKAPEGQPTSNIEFQLKHAKTDAAEWRWSEKIAKQALETAVGARARAELWVEELEYQLAQRRIEGRD